MILSPEEASQILDYNTTDEMPEKVSAIFLPAIDMFLKDASGKDWGMLTETYTIVDPVAKMAAGVLLRRWFDDPGQIGQADDTAVLGLIGQLHAKVSLERQTSA